MADNSDINFINIPRNYIKLGEVFCKSEQPTPIFVCFVCLKNTNNISTTYSTSDGSLLWCHIKQKHITSVICESMGKISAEIEDFETESVESEISYGEITSQEDKLVYTDDDKVRQNQIKLLDDFHDVLVTNTIANGMDVLSQDVDNLKETDQCLENSSKETNTKEDVKPNFEKSLNNFTNYNYDCDEIYTIPEDASECEFEENGDSNFLAISKHHNAISYLKHNDMVEISDDDLSEDNSETCLSSPNIIDEETKNIESLAQLDSNKSPKNNKENIIISKNYIFDIPTPDISPSETLSTQHYNINFGYDQLNYNWMVYNKDSQAKKIKPKNQKKAFLAFQCSLCGRRTANEKTMQIHFQRFHYSLLPDSSAHANYHPYYHRLQQLHQEKQQEELGNADLKRPFRCKSCKGRTQTLKSMERHQQIYHGPLANVLRIKCDICCKRILASKLELHMKLHFSAPFSCIYCGVVYKHKVNLDSHISKQHSNVNSVPVNVQHPGINCMPITTSEVRLLPARPTIEPEKYQQACVNTISCNNVTLPL